MSAEVLPKRLVRLGRVSRHDEAFQPCALVRRHWPDCRIGDCRVSAEHLAHPPRIDVDATDLHRGITSAFRGMQAL
jgi:hypothetical protein